MLHLTLRKVLFYIINMRATKPLRHCEKINYIQVQSFRKRFQSFVS